MTKKYIEDHLNLKVTDKKVYIITELYCDENLITKCKINISNNYKKWTISEWFTTTNFQHMGFGKVALKNALIELLNQYGEPNEIEYIWNGVNQYVYDWLVENFDAKCECPIAVLKKQADDDYLSHMYMLNKNKVLNHFNLKEKI